MIDFVLYVLLALIIVFMAVVAVRVFVEEWKNKEYICALLESGIIVFSSALFCAIYFYVINIENTI